MHLKPLSDHVLIEPLKEETKGGIVLPETVDREKPMQGKVVAVGPGKMNEQGTRNPMQVRTGDKVLFRKYGPDEIKMTDPQTGSVKEYLIGREEDILAVITG